MEMGGVVIVKTKEDLIKELDFTQQQMLKFPEKYYEHDVAEMVYRDNNNPMTMHLIQNNCVKNKCFKHDVINYKGCNLHVCFDDWSSCKVGWHITYCETCCLCFEYKLRKENNNE